MNFLAHCALADDAATYYQADQRVREGLIAGGVIGDFVKGSVPQDWPTPLQAGVRLHRKIDALSNLDTGIRTLSASFPAELRRFAPIFLDLVADHSLAKDWSEHYAHDRYLFSQDCYHAIATYADFLPEHGTRFFDYMQDADLLANYDQWRHVERGTHSVLRRLRRDELRGASDAAMRKVVPATSASLVGIFGRLRQGLEDWQPF